MSVPTKIKTKYSNSNIPFGQVNKYLFLILERMPVKNMTS